MEDSKGVERLLSRLFEETDKINDKVKQEIKFLWEWGIGRISNDVVRKAVSNYYLAQVPFQFFISPVSLGASPLMPHTKKRHPSWHNVAGGIVRHIAESCVGADRQLTLFGFVDEDERVDADARDIVLAATLATDTQKNGLPWSEKTVRNHGEIAARIWDRVAIGCGVPRNTREQITEAVFWHYGRYTPTHPKKSFQELPELVKIVHILDACSASRDNELIYRPVENIPSPESLS